MYLPSKSPCHQLLLSFCVLVLAGCNDGPNLAPVEGTVTLDGVPLEGATVLFEFDGGGRPSTGITDGQGRFILKTLKAGDGAYVGLNHVAVIKEVPVVGDVESGEDGGEYMGEAMDLVTPAIYASPRTSELSVDVQHGMEPVELKLVGQP